METSDEFGIFKEIDASFFQQNPKGSTDCHEFPHSERQMVKKL